MWNIVKRAQQFNLYDEKRKSEGKKRDEKEKRGEGGEKRKRVERKGKEKKRKIEMQR